MDVQKLVEYWRSSSDYDLETAVVLFRGRRYPYCLFMCHLSLEKMLKAAVVKKTNRHAPYWHELNRLAALTNIDFSKERLDFLDEVSNFNIAARYNDYKSVFYKRCTKNYTEKYLNKTRDLQKWLKTYLKKRQEKR